MRKKLLVAIVNDQSTERVMDVAREAGASGATVIQEARGQGRKGLQALLGLDLNACRDLILFIVPDYRAPRILECVAGAARFDEEPGTGIVCQVDVEDSIGLSHQALEWAAQFAASEERP